MKRSTALALVGAILLLSAAAVPFVGLLMAEWDTDYVYSIESGDSYCANVVHESGDVDGVEEFRVDYHNLSETGQRHFQRALADGKYVVENEVATAPDFHFIDDHITRGYGCYAIHYEGETYALQTSQQTEQVGPMSSSLPLYIGGGLLVLGGGLFLVGVGLAGKHRLK
ncbi:hypothetical protein [Halospeciosus flavus]|uniref:DUF7979 domain-containing protein n=1 Tax=Halospeciosus flavus TaxID=3032283 RepID=A0ABD5Z3F6_9EURY|nr:hypothetical protein [Halospeciosus flavus]